MIYEGLRIKTPSSNYINKYVDFKGYVYYTFFYNYCVKNKETNIYEVKERYIINIYNIIPNPDSEIICTKIVNCKPKESISGDKTYFNVCVTIEAENVSKEKLPRYCDNARKNQNDNDIENSSTKNATKEVEEIKRIDEEDNLPF